MGLDIYFHKRLNRQNAPKAEEISDLCETLYKADTLTPEKVDENEALLKKGLAILDEGGEPVTDEQRSTITGFRSAVENYAGHTELKDKDFALMTEEELDICRAVVNPEHTVRNLLWSLWNRITEDEEVAYFRKVNLLVEYFQYEHNCSDMIVTKEQLEGLLQKAKHLIKFSVDHPVDTEEFKDEAAATLRTQSGFFFGNTEYDEWYLKDLESIVKTLTPVVEDTDFSRYDIVFHCWW